MLLEVEKLIHELGKEYSKFPNGNTRDAIRAVINALCEIATKQGNPSAGDGKPNGPVGREAQSETVETKGGPPRM